MNLKSRDGDRPRKRRFISSKPARGSLKDIMESNALTELMLGANIVGFTIYLFIRREGYFLPILLFFSVLVAWSFIKYRKAMYHYLGRQVKEKYEKFSEWRNINLTTNLAALIMFYVFVLPWTLMMNITAIHP